MFMLLYIVVYFYSEYYSGIRAHRLGSTCRKPYITSQGRKYKDQEHRLETTFGEGDCILVEDTKEEGPMASEKDEGREFEELLLEYVQELSRKIEEMG